MAYIGGQVPQKVTSSMDCPYCVLPGVNFILVPPTEAARNYEDSPGITSRVFNSNRRASQGDSPLPSPVKPGDSFDKMRAKMITFEQAGYRNVRSQLSATNSPGRVSPKVDEDTETSPLGNSGLVYSPSRPSVSIQNLLQHALQNSVVQNLMQRRSRQNSFTSTIASIRETTPRSSNENLVEGAPGVGGGTSGSYFNRPPMFRSRSNSMVRNASYPLSSPNQRDSTTHSVLSHSSNMIDDYDNRSHPKTFILSHSGNLAYPNPNDDDNSGNTFDELIIEGSSSTITGLHNKHNSFSSENNDNNSSNSSNNSSNSNINGSGSDNSDNNESNINNIGNHNYVNTNDLHHHTEIHNDGVDNYNTKRTTNS